MNKKQVQKRVLQGGKPLALSKFTWCEKTKTFSSKENDLVIDFAGIWDCTFTTGGDCTFKTGGDCTFKTGERCTFTVNGYLFPCAPLHFTGNRHDVFVNEPSKVSIGCHTLTVSDWLTKGPALAKGNHYTEEQQTEYRLYIDMCKMWFDCYGGKIVPVEAA